MTKAAGSTKPAKPVKAAATSTEKLTKNQIIAIITIGAGAVVLFIAVIIFLVIKPWAGNNAISGGANNTANGYEQAKEQGKIYAAVNLQDAGVAVFSGIAPQGWRASIVSSWNVVSSTVPGKEVVTLMAPTLDASITFISQTAYVDNSKYADGENYDYYTTYKKLQDAGTYLDDYIDMNYSAKKIKDLVVPAETLEQLRQYNAERVETGKVIASQMANNTVGISVSDAGVSSAKRQYQIGDNLIEGATAVAATKTSLRSTLSSLLDSDAIDWNVPYVIIFKADNKAAFDKYYDTYNFIVANSQFTTDYYAMVEFVSSEITKQYTAYYAAKSQAALDATNSYIESHYSSDSSRSTNEKVMEMWDDVIKEVDSYKTEDGTTIKTSIMNDTVAQNGNEFYIGDKAGIPLGFTQLDKGY